jgi:predicted Zn-dependent protease
MQFKINAAVRGFILHVILGSLLAFGGCVSAPIQNHEESVSTRMQKEREWGEKLSKKFEKQVVEKKDSEIQKYLENLIVKMEPSIRGPASHELKVKLFKTNKPVWLNYTIPGGYLYMSLDALRSIEFENELAAMLALQMGHIHHRHIIGHLKDKNEEQVQDLFSPAGLFAYSFEELVEADQFAYKLLYSNGYDPRGIISVWNRLEKNSEFSYYPKETLRALAEKTRQMIVESTPLRNPIVRTTGFYVIQKRIQRL